MRGGGDRLVALSDQRKEVHLLRNIHLLTWEIISQSDRSPLGGDEVAKVFGNLQTVLALKNEFQGAEKPREVFSSFPGKRAVGACL